MGLFEVYMAYSNIKYRKKYMKGNTIMSETKIMLGNEAIARGAFEAGVKVSYTSFYVFDLDMIRLHCFFMIRKSLFDSVSPCFDPRSTWMRRRFHEALASQSYR